MFAALKNGQTEIDAIVWDFKDKDQGNDLALYLGLLLNRTQRRNWGEIWHLYQVLELQSSITLGTLEYLLQLESGDAIKLKDVMLCDYDEVKQALLSGEKNLDGAYKIAKNEGNRAVTDEDFVKSAKNEIKQLKELGEFAKNKPEKLIELAEKISYASSILPEMVNEQTILDYLTEHNIEKNIGTCMKALKTKFGARLDGKVAQMVVKHYIG